MTVKVTTEVNAVMKSCVLHSHLSCRGELLVGTYIYVTLCYITCLTDDHVRKYFVRVAQNRHVMARWQALAYTLGLYERDIEDIEKAYSGTRERCLQVSPPDYSKLRVIR